MRSAVIHTHTHTQLYTHTHTYTFQTLFPYRLLQNVEFSFLCCIVGPPCWLSILYTVVCIWRFPSWRSGRESTCSAGDTSSIPGSGRSPGEGNANPLQYSCLENPMDRGALLATLFHGVAKELHMA